MRPDIRRRVLLAALVAGMHTLACNHPAHFVTPVPTPDPREFSWTIDTIAVPGSSATLMKSIWGSSPSDVYIVGHNDLPGGTMFHFNGGTWQPVGLTAAEGGSIPGSIDLSQVMGFAASDIVAVGGVTAPGTLPGDPQGSLVIHYDGKTWNAMQVPPGGILHGVWGEYQSEIWAAGESGTVIRYLGLNWIPVLFPDSLSLVSIAGVSTDNLYAIGSGRGGAVHDSTFRTLWHWNGGVWSIDDSLEELPGHADRFGTRSVWSLLAIVYTSGSGMFRKDGSVWDQLVPPQGSGPFNAVYGTLSSSLFVVGDGSGVFHVDPASWYRYPQFTAPGINYYGAWTDGREAFIVGNDGRKTYVLHGK